MGLFAVRGPSRLLWFVIGAMTATWWIKRKQCESRVFGHCLRPAIQPTDSKHRDGWTQNAVDVSRAINNIPIAPTPMGDFNGTGTGTPASAGTPQVSWDRDHARHSWQWDQWQGQAEREQFSRMSRQAADAMVDLTETTLESVLTTAEALKAKLAEHRARREQEQKIIEQQLEEERRKSPPRLV
ncbi:unnamed protein product [Cyclocybe aegerita]|uniref:Uncharacterized protein n=1 Tax=Cyclocybe aegerita TaxID=1973307 RepID=A0A8S0WPE6_CYCAE|nr:unnamed protein product [Cyclocybe aegerita]